MPIKKLMQQHHLCDVETIYDNGDMILHTAVKSDKLTTEEIIESLRYLLDQEFNMNTRNKKQETVLHVAMKNGAKDIIDFLLTYKQKLERTTSGEDPVIKCLLETERSIMLELEKQSTMSEDEKKKIESERAEFVEWIVSKGFKITDSTVSMAIWQNLYHIVPALSKYMPTIENKKVTRTMLEQLIWTIKYSKQIWYPEYITRHVAGVVKALVDKGFPLKDCDSEVQIAVLKTIDSEGHIKIIEGLIETLRNINSVMNSSKKTLFQAVLDKWLDSEKPNVEYYIQILNAFIANGANVNEPNLNTFLITPLCSAVEKKNLRAIEFLRDNEADFNVTSEDDDTLLHMLLYGEYKKIHEKIDIIIFDMLIERGCQVNAKHDGGMTPLHVAADRGNVTIARKLIEHGANVNSRDNRDRTPLHVASRYIRPDVVELLSKCGANINAIDNEGNTALIHAISSRIEEGMKVQIDRLYKFLLENGAELNKDFSFLSKYDNWYDEIVEKTENLFSLGDNKNTIIKRYKNVEVLLKHWVKLRAANLKSAADSEYENQAKMVDNQEFYQKCIVEIETLKNTFVDKFKRVSFYTFLHMSHSRRCIYINEENLKNLMEDQKTLKNKFPEYSTVILASYREAVTRKPLLEPAKEAWLELTEIDLPDICLECILSFMSNSDLFNIIGEE